MRKLLLFALVFLVGCSSIPRTELCEHAWRSYLNEFHGSRDFSCGGDADWVTCPSPSDLDSMARFGWFYAEIKYKRMGWGNCSWNHLLPAQQRTLALDAAIEAGYTHIWGSVLEGRKRAHLGSDKDKATFLLLVIGLRERIERTRSRYD